MQIELIFTETNSNSEMGCLRYLVFSSTEFSASEVKVSPLPPPLVVVDAVPYIMGRLTRALASKRVEPFLSRA